jgi:amino acid adenylation domain-containing protein/non-ribosomal peptide synthase protein (TIGR01720 family)
MEGTHLYKKVTTSSSHFDIEKEYWLTRLSGEEKTTGFPHDYPGPNITLGESERAAVMFTFPAEMVQKLLTISNQSKLGLFMIFITGIVYLLSRYNGDEEVITLTPVLEQKVYGTSTHQFLVLKNSVKEEMAFKDLLLGVKQTLSEANEHMKYFPFTEIIKLLHLPVDRHQSPIFETMIVFENLYDHDEDRKNDRGVNTFFSFKMSADGIEGEINYNAALFDEITIEGLTRHLLNYFQAVSQNPRLKLSEINLLSNKEKERILKEFNNTETYYPTDKMVHQLFEEQVEKAPWGIALMADDYKISYRRLNNITNYLAAILKHKGIGADAIVGIMVEGSIEMLVGILGILKAGGAYLPIDFEYPLDRIKYMLEDSNTQLVLSKDEYIPIIGNIAEGFNLTDICLYKGENESENKHLKTGVTSVNLAYVTFTSGSTGKPKGVMVKHTSVVNLLLGLHKVYPCVESDAYLLKTSYVFDVSVTELFGWYLQGGRLVIPEEESKKDTGKIVETVEREGVTHINFVPSMFGVFVNTLNKEDSEDVGGISSLKYIFLAGEALPGEMVLQFRKLSTRIQLENIYGPTEATVYACNYSLRDWKGKGNLPIGKPLPNVKLYIVDNGNRLQPMGVMGELCIAGIGMAKGYLNRPGLTALKFVPDPFEPGKPMYKTGDLARWQTDGNVEFLGRIDHQVKIRGFRIELGEIESQLLNHNDIIETVVINFEKEEGQKYLCAYFVSATTCEPYQLREHLAGRLPDYMIPAYFVQLPKIPYTPSGKIDRKVLPEPEISLGKDKYTSPRNEIERELAGIWSDVLKVPEEDVGIDFNFFEMGGHSLKANIMVSRIHKTIDVKLGLSEVLKRPTIRTLAQYIKEASVDRYSSIEPAEDKEYYQLSSPQKRLFVLQQMDETSTGYHIPFIVKLEGPLDKEKLETTFRELIKRHECLRTSFEMIKSEPVQRIHDEVGFEIEYFGVERRAESVELSSTPGAMRYAGVIENFVRPFDLSKAPLLRVGLIQFNGEEHILMVDMHHIISDGTSNSILMREFAALYMGETLPPLKLQYKDYSQWKNKEKEKESVQKQGEFWRQQFEGEIPVIDLPTDYIRPAVQSFEGNRIDFVLPSEQTKVLKEMAVREEVTLYMLVLALCNIFLSKMSNQEDIVIGTPIAGRGHTELEPMIGVFINTLCLRNYPGGEKTFKEFLSHVKERTLEAFENQEYQYEELVEQVAVTRDVSRNPIFDFMLIFQNIYTGSVDIPEVDIPDLKLAPYMAGNFTSKFDLTLQAQEVGEKLFLTFEYCTKLFHERTILRFISYFKRIVSHVEEGFDGRLSDLEILSGKERKQLLIDFNRTETEYPGDKTIHQLFEEQVEKTPHNPAVVGWDIDKGGYCSLSYEELNEKCNRLAWLLMEKGVKPNTIVGLMTERTLGMVIGLLAILKTGASYLPIEPDYPEERTTYMLQHSQTEIVLVTGPVSLQESGVLFIKINEWEEGQIDAANLSGISSPTDLAYLIYTSGTTGKPKGVMIENRSVVNFIKGITNVVPFTPEDAILSLTTLSFDIFGLETLLPLTRGSKVVIGRREEQVDSRAAGSLMEREGVTIFQVTPSRLQLFISEPEAAGSLKLLDYLLVGGEAFPEHLLEEVRKVTRGCVSIYNMYGPTETTIWSTIKDVSGDKVLNIGKPIANTQIYILDRVGHLQPIGVPGELCIGGDGAARGYLNHPELTAEKFTDFFEPRRVQSTQREDPFLETSAPFVVRNRIYKTGDLARWLEDGNIEFLGRFDHQVKIRGYRIELEEIEYQLQQHPGIKDVVVTAYQWGDDKSLCAYIVPFSSESASTEQELSTDTTAVELREYLSGCLPDYMIPSYYVKLEVMPLTPNGKIDRKALSKLEILETGEDYIAPRDEVERKLELIWSEVLRVESEKIGIDANFFRLGGHSLRATVLISWIHKELSVRIPLTEIFNKPTIRELARYIREAVQSRFVSIEPVEKRSYYPLSSAQRRMYILKQLEPEGTEYNLPRVIPLAGEVDRERLAQTFCQLINRHESLRTSFTAVEGEPVQRIHDEAEFEVEYFNLTAKTREDTRIKEENLHSHQSFIIHHFVRAFDLSKAPLLRVGLIELDDGMHLLVADIHHIVSDGVSMQLLVGDFIALYRGEELPLLQIQYKDYAHWQQKEIQQEAIKQQEAYWLEEFAGEIPLLNLPTDFPRPAFQRFEGRRIGVLLSINETQQLKKLASTLDITLYMVLVGTLNALLSRLSGSEDIVMGTAVAGRRHADLEPVIGMFVNTLALKSQPLAEKTVKIFMQEVKEKTLQAFENQDYPFEELVEKISVERDVSRNSVFDVMFTLQNMLEQPVRFQQEALPSPGEREMVDDWSLNPISKFDLTILAYEGVDEVAISFEYATALFIQGTIQRFIGYFKKVITGMAENPEARLSDIQIISDEEKQQILFDFNQTRTDYPRDKTIHELFAEQAARTPDGVSLVGSWQLGVGGVALPADKGKITGEAVQLTYGELNQRSDQLAQILKEKGVLADSIIGIMMARSVEIIIGILGILKAGGAYLPIDPEYPQERIEYVLKDSGTKILLTENELFSWLSSAPKALFKLSAGHPYPPATCNPHLRLAYVIYTSGTTGRPKGSMILHKNVVRLLFNNEFQFDFTESDTWTLFHSLAFDFSVWEMYGALLYGGRLVVVPRMTARDPREFLEVLTTQEVTVLNQTPAAFYNLSNLEMQRPGRTLKIRYVIFGGDALKPLQLKPWKEKYPETRLVNMFGITETTVHVTYKEIEEEDIVVGVSNIGRPIPTLSTYIFDRHLQLVPVGVAGEICVGGEGVCWGYLNQPELTREKFVENSYINGERLYRSGDLGRYSGSGDIEYLGRLDHQVKIRGYRIELEEIEYQLQQHPGIKDVVVTAYQWWDDKSLCAYIVPFSSKSASTEQEPPTDITTVELREYLSGSLPDYMIPSYYVKLEAIPLTPNGKINRKELPEPGKSSLDNTIEYVEPGNEIERAMAEIWEDVLGRRNIGVNENFFTLGGDSIKAIQIVSRMNKAGYKLDMKDVFCYQTISQAAPNVKRLERIADQSVITGEIPLTPIQEAFFETHKIDPHHFNQSVMLYSKESFDETAINAVFMKIQEHHDALRMTYKKDNGRIIQINQSVDYPFSLEIHDFRNLEKEKAIKVLEIEANRIQGGINLETGPMMKLGLFHLDDGDRLLIVIHHLVIDGVSWRILFEDMETLYRQYTKGEPLVLPLKTDSYKVWSEELTRYANSELFLEERNYWSQLKSIDVHLPGIKPDFQVANNYQEDNAIQSFVLNEAQTTQLLTKVNESFGTEINDILLASLGLAVREIYGHDRLLIALEGHGREEILDDVNISRTVGWFTSVHPVLLNLSYYHDLARQMKEIKENLHQVPNKGIGYGMLKHLTAKKNKHEDRLMFNHLPEINFNYLGQFDGGLEQMESFGMAKESSGNMRSLKEEREYKFDVSGVIKNNRLIMSISYNKKQFKPETIEKLTSQYEQELNRLITYCSEKREREITPSDFGIKGLSIEDFDALYE